MKSEDEDIADYLNKQQLAERAWREASGDIKQRLLQLAWREANGNIVTAVKRLRLWTDLSLVTAAMAIRETAPSYQQTTRLH